MTEFSKRVYDVVKGIPRGSVMSYGRVAALAGNARAARGVGYALSHVDGEGLPCHRVVFADGSLARDAVFGGEGVQRRLLEAEGVPFLPDGRVDMEKCAL